ncbi:hypothetical protein G7046_g9291 [Stylonectria norvegica]|nr:hypothetical protein G7046_g9291 [Stylonectria norvegica]
MPPANPKANYKTYEAQARMVRAIVAAHSDVKWNYKEIAACYGSDMSEHALNHRFRRLRAQAIIVRDGRALGFDMKDLVTEDNALPKTQETVEKNNIAKYFGQSTPDGIQFQFRGIKQDASLLKQVESEGGDVANCLSVGAGSSMPNTPAKATPRKPAGSRSGTTTAKRSRAATFIKRASSDDEDEEIDVENWSEKDETPSKRAKTGPTRGSKASTPSRRAATKANATIVKLQQSSESPPEEALTPKTTFATSPVCVAPASIFGPVPTRKSTVQSELDSTMFSSFMANDSTTSMYGSGYPDDTDMFSGTNVDDDYDGDGQC